MISIKQFFKENPVDLYLLIGFIFSLLHFTLALAFFVSMVYFVVKRVFDVICSLIGIMLLIPISIVVKISYLITGDTESIFYKQKRIGKNGRLFDFYKIRTMIPNADEKLDKILENDEELAEEYSKNKKLKNDPRITKVGKFLRKTSLDEFPQFIN